MSSIDRQLVDKSYFVKRQPFLDHFLAFDWIGMNTVFKVIFFFVFLFNYAVYRMHLIVVFFELKSVFILFAIKFKNILKKVFCFETFLIRFVFIPRISGFVFKLIRFALKLECLLRFIVFIQFDEPSSAMTNKNL